eukprot:3867291-Pyramimonas_sp.AAC.1
MVWGRPNACSDTLEYLRQLPRKPLPLDTMRSGSHFSSSSSLFHAQRRMVIIHRDNHASTIHTIEIQSKVRLTEPPLQPPRALGEPTADCGLVQVLPTSSSRAAAAQGARPAPP